MGMNLTPPITNMHLASYFDQPSYGSTRVGYGHGLIEAATENPQVVALCADLTESLKMDGFAKQFPDRFVEMGVSEQNMVGVAAGMALAGKVAFAASYAVFSPGRTWDQLRVSVCYSNLNVKIIGGHAGVLTGPDGATHQALEDIAITRVLPNLTVVVPCDEEQARQATLRIAKTTEPTYLRLNREKSLNVTTPDTPFTLGKAQILRPGVDIAIIACGEMVAEALIAAEALSQERIDCRVINMHTIKPLDVQTIMVASRETKLIITVEDHQVAGGLGSAVAEVTSELHSVPVLRIGIQDQFGESGLAGDLMKKYGLTSHAIVQLAKQYI